MLTVLLFNKLIKVYEFGNGCICCSASVELQRTLDKLRASHEASPFTHVIIETTGRALAGPVARMLLSDACKVNYY